MVKKTKHDYLDGVTLSSILDVLIEDIGYEELYEKIQIKCFLNNPSKQSSLKFLRKTPRAREQIEGIYVKHMRNNK